MFNRKPKSDPGLESVIADIERELRDDLVADSDEYKAALARYRDLKILQTETQSKKVSPDTLVNAAASVLGILVIVMYEQKAVMASKAVGFVKKLI